MSAVVQAVIAAAAAAAAADATDAVDVPHTPAQTGVVADRVAASALLQRCCLQALVQHA